MSVIETCHFTLLNTRSSRLGVFYKVYPKIMTIKVLFFASLRERIGKQQAIVESEVPIAAAEVWVRGGGGSVLPGNVLVSVNQAYATVDTLVNTGDEVAFFPPVTGG